MRRVALHTLGCKVNQYETGRIAEEFEARGFRTVGFADQADVYVINSCTVTGTADSKSRQAARAAHNRNPNAAVVLTGCYAETSADEAAGIEGVALVIGNQDKSRLVEMVVRHLGEEMAPARVPVPQSQSSRTVGRTRALLKVQDGCDQYCSYCAIPYARSVMTSRPLAEVVTEAQSLANRGFGEIVLTGIRIGRYQDGNADLADLMSALADVDGIERIRVSSIELTDIPSELPVLMARNSRICRHLHIPLQSGDDEILRRMNRPYASGEFAASVERLRDFVPGIAITTDVIVGFPGETESQFGNTLKLVERIRFARSHVFRYSPRKGTAAAALPDDIPAAEKESRSRRLIELAGACSRRFAESLVGGVAHVIVEGKEAGPGMLSGLTDTYVRVVFPADASLVGRMVCVRVDSAAEGVAHGTVLSE